MSIRCRGTTKENAGATLPQCDKSKPMSLRRVLGVYSICFLIVDFQPINELSPRTATKFSSVKPDFPTEKRKSCQFIFVFFFLKVKPPKAAQIKGFILRNSYYKVMFSNIFLLFFSREICFLVEHSINANSHQETSKNHQKIFALSKLLRKTSKRVFSSFELR